ncbi:MAG: ergothioneine biosynthesis protein EgtB [Bdellovibrionales bacterium]|nr:ergothioneine biosynthesis protein EgtB [Bdellovibrionales bacterium]
MRLYESVREQSLQLCANLETEDHAVQPFPFVSPPKWHLGHTTWFFETFCLRQFFNMDVFDTRFPYVFNSYYESQGRHIEQGRRGVLSRPTLDEVHAYRAHVDGRMYEASLLISDRSDEPAWRRILELGLQHEQQHQELLLMDIKSILFEQPAHPAYSAAQAFNEYEDSVAEEWLSVPGGIYSVGKSGDEFAFDNESPRHQVLLQDFKIRKDLVSNGEYLAFVEDGGYTQAKHWLSDGWRWVRENSVRHPLYWRNTREGWQEYTLGGMQTLAARRPVAHVSYYEADAFARWKNARLPTEFEWEAAFGDQPRAPLWQWTQSAYLAYPGYRPFAGAFAEYNGKFMVGQMVLRGGCFATPESHYRSTYRNFFYPEMRWQFSGIRLAL